MQTTTVKRDKQIDAAISSRRGRARGNESHDPACNCNNKPSQSGTGEVEPVAARLTKLPRRERIAAICDGVIDITAALFSISSKDLRHPNRCSVDIARVRQIAMYAAHVTLALSMRDVGQGFGRDRTTVLYACHQIEDMRDDEEFDRIVSTTERVIAAAFGHVVQGASDR